MQRTRIIEKADKTVHINTNSNTDWFVIVSGREVFGKYDKNNKVTIETKVTTCGLSLKV